MKIINALTELETTVNAFNFKKDQIEKRMFKILKDFLEVWSDNTDSSMDFENIRIVTEKRDFCLKPGESEFYNFDGEKMYIKSYEGDSEDLTVLEKIEIINNIGSTVKILCGILRTDIDIFRDFENILK